MKKWQVRTSAALLTGAMVLGTPVSALAEVDKVSISEEKQEVSEKSTENEKKADAEEKETSEKADSNESVKEENKKEDTSKEEEKIDKDLDSDSKNDEKEPESEADANNGTDKDADADKKPESDKDDEVKEPDKDIESGDTKEDDAKDPEKEPETDADQKDGEKTPEDETKPDEVVTPDETIPEETLKLAFSEKAYSVLAGKTLDAGELLELPGKYSLSDVSWTSGNEKIAKVDKNGVITAIAAGSCKIRAEIKEADLSATITVTVKADENTRIQEIIKLIDAMPEAKKENIEEIAKQLEDISVLYDEIEAMPEEEQAKITNLQKLIDILELASSEITTTAMNGECGENVTYTLDDAGTLTISGSGKMDNYNQGDSPWNSKKNSIKKVVIKSGVTYIGRNAFYGLTNLLAVSMSEVKEIGGSSFENCSRLKELELPASLKEIGGNAFRGCKELTELMIPGKVTKIGYEAFYDCSRLSSVIFAEGTESMEWGDYIFQNCSMLSKIAIPGRLSQVSSNAFVGCSRLSSVIMKSGVQKIGVNAFNNCQGLSKVEFPATLTFIGRSSFAGCKKLTSIIIPESVETIDTYAFCESALKTVTFKEGINKIGYGAFQDCIGIGTLTLPKSLQTIDDYAFQRCSSLTKVTFPTELVEMGSYAFADCKNLTTISSIPGSLTSIPAYAFAGCTSLKTAKLESGVLTVGNKAFLDCTELKSVELPDTLIEIGTYTFNNCKNLEAATIPGSVNKIGYGAFQDAGIKKLILRSGISNIDEYAFSGCENLTDVNIPGSVNEIGSRAFDQCSNVKTISLADGISKIGSYAFAAEALTSVTIPGSVTSIGFGAFCSNDNLKNVVIQDGVTQIESWAFSNCPKLASVAIPESVAFFDDYIFGYSYNIPSTLKIYGTKGSFAEDYANENNIPFVDPANIKLATPTITKMTNTVSGVHVYWNTVPNATAYTVYRATSKNGTYTRVASVSATNYTDIQVTSGTTYFYKIRANVATVQSGASAAKGMAFVDTPDITLRVNRSTGIGLGWNRIAGATGYVIYRRSYDGSDAWVRVATVTDNSTLTWVDTSAKPKNGTIFRYTVRALAGSDRKTLSGCRNTGRTMVRLFTPTISSAANASATSMKVAWNRNAQASGYEVRLMVNGSVYKTYTVGGGENLAKTITSLTKGTTYKVQVRSYKKVTGVGSFYSAWSAEKNVTVQ